MTCGMLSPTMMQNATMPPNALCDEVSELPKHIQRRDIQCPLGNGNGY